MKAPRSVAVALFLAALSASLFAASDYYLKIPDIEGESAVRKGEIEIDSFSWGMEFKPSSTGSGGAGLGEVVLHEIAIKKRLDKSTPKLMLACASADPIPQVLLTVTKPNPKGTGQPVEYLRITLSDVFVTSYQTGGSSGDVPMESLSLNFERVRFEYVPYHPVSGDPEPAVIFEHTNSPPST